MGCNCITPVTPQGRKPKINKQYDEPPSSPEGLRSPWNQHNDVNFSGYFYQKHI